MRPSSKFGPAMAGPTGPVPPGLMIMLHVTYLDSTCTDATARSRLEILNQVVTPLCKVYFSETRGCIRCFVSMAVLSLLDVCFLVLGNRSCGNSKQHSWPTSTVSAFWQDLLADSATLTNLCITLVLRITCRRNKAYTPGKMSWMNPGYKLL